MRRALKWLAAAVLACGALLFGRRADAAQRSGRWPRVRGSHLELFPRCAACGAIKGLDVHHKKPVHLFPDLELVPGNLITLCSERCHFLIGHLLDWKSWNPEVDDDAARLLDRIRCRPKVG